MPCLKFSQMKDLAYVKILINIKDALFRTPFPAQADAVVSLPPKHSSNWLSGFVGLHHEGVQQTTTGAKTRLEGSNSCSLCKDLASRAGLEAKESREGGRTPCWK